MEERIFENKTKGLQPSWQLCEFRLNRAEVNRSSAGILCLTKVWWEVTRWVPSSLSLLDLTGLLCFRLLIVDLLVFQVAPCACIKSAMSAFPCTQWTAVYKDTLFLDCCLLKWDHLEASVLPNRFGPVPQRYNISASAGVFHCSFWVFTIKWKPHFLWDCFASSAENLERHLFTSYTH